MDNPKDSPLIKSEYPLENKIVPIVPKTLNSNRIIKSVIVLDPEKLKRLGLGSKTLLSKDAGKLNQTQKSNSKPSVSIPDIPGVSLSKTYTPIPQTANIKLYSTNTLKSNDVTPKFNLELLKHKLEAKIKLKNLLEQKKLKGKEKNFQDTESIVSPSSQKTEQTSIQTCDNSENIEKNLRSPKLIDICNKESFQEPNLVKTNSKRTETVVSDKDDSKKFIIDSRDHTSESNKQQSPKVIILKNEKISPIPIHSQKLFNLTNASCEGERLSITDRIVLDPSRSKQNKSSSNFDQQKVHIKCNDEITKQQTNLKIIKNQDKEKITKSSLDLSNSLVSHSCNLSDNLDPSRSKQNKYSSNSDQQEVHIKCNDEITKQQTSLKIIKKQDKERITKSSLDSSNTLVSHSCNLYDNVKENQSEPTDKDINYIDQHQFFDDNMIEVIAVEDDYCDEDINIPLESDVVDHKIKSPDSSTVEDKISFRKPWSIISYAEQDHDYSITEIHPNTDTVPLEFENMDVKVPNDNEIQINESCTTSVSTPVMKKYNSIRSKNDSIIRISAKSKKIKMQKLNKRVKLLEEENKKLSNYLKSILQNLDKDAVQKSLPSNDIEMLKMSLQNQRENITTTKVPRYALAMENKPIETNLSTKNCQNLEPVPFTVINKSIESVKGNIDLVNSNETRHEVIKLHEEQYEQALKISESWNKSNEFSKETCIIEEDPELLDDNDDCDEVCNTDEVEEENIEESTTGIDNDLEQTIRIENDHCMKERLEEPYLVITSSERIQETVDSRNHTLESNKNKIVNELTPDNQISLSIPQSKIDLEQNYTPQLLLETNENEKQQNFTTKTQPDSNLNPTSDNGKSLLKPVVSESITNQQRELINTTKEPTLITECQEKINNIVKTLNVTNEQLFESNENNKTNKIIPNYHIHNSSLISTSKVNDSIAQTPKKHQSNLDIETTDIVDWKHKSIILSSETKENGRQEMTNIVEEPSLITENLKCIREFRDSNVTDDFTSLSIQYSPDININKITNEMTPDDRISYKSSSSTPRLVIDLDSMSVYKNEEEYNVKPPNLMINDQSNLHLNRTSDFVKDNSKPILSKSTTTRNRERPKRNKSVKISEENPIEEIKIEEVRNVVCNSRGLPMRKSASNSFVSKNFKLEIPPLIDKKNRRSSLPMINDNNNIVNRRNSSYNSSNVIEDENSMDAKELPLLKPGRRKRKLSPSDGDTTNINENTTTVITNTAENEAGKLKGGRRKRKLSPSDECSSKDEEKITTVITNNVENETNKVNVKKGGTICGRCNETVKRNWLSHLQKHNGLAWRLNTDDPVIDLTNEKLVLQAMINFSKQFKKPINFVCEQCGISRKSALGLISHMNGCGTEDGGKIECEYCQARLLPVSMKSHLISCLTKIQAIEKKSITEEEETTNDVTTSGRLKRKSVKKAEIRLKEVMESTRIEELYSEVGPKRVTGGHTLNIRRQLRLQDFWKCETCGFIEKDQNKILSHIGSCGQVTGFFCKQCDFSSKSRTTMEEHIKEVHMDILQKEEEEEEKVSDDSDASINEEEFSESDESSGVDELEEETVETEESESSDFDDNYGAAEIKKSIKYGTNDSYKPTKVCSLMLQSYAPSLRQPPGSLSYNPTKSLTKIFIQKYLSSEPLFTDFIAYSFSHLNPNKINDYLPLVRKSLKFDVEINNNYDENLHFVKDEKNLNELELYQDQSLKNSCVFFCGGVVQSMDWVPLPEDYNDKQYLAISVKNDLNLDIKMSDKKAYKCLIQIWSIDRTKGRNGVIKSTHEYSLVFNYGPIYDIKFCPSGGYIPDLRLGILAVTSVIGDVYLFALPININSKLESMNTISINPSQILSWKIDENINNKYGNILRKVAWTNDKNHSIIVSGSVTGLVCIWNLNIKSSLLKRVIDDVSYLLPCKTFYAFNGAITALEIFYLNKSKYLMIGSDKFCKIFDVNNFTQPVELSAQLQKSLILCMAWPKHWPAVIIGKDEVYAFPKNIITLVQPRDIGYRNHPLQCVESVITDISFSDYFNVYILVTDSGDIYINHCRELLCNVSIKYPRLYRMLLGYTSLIKFDETDDKDNEDPSTKCHINCFTSETQRTTGILFCDTDIMLESSIIKKYRRFKLYDYPLTRIQKVKFNSNLNNMDLYAIGYQVGFVRIKKLHKKSMNMS